MQCPACQHENAPTMKFCGECGAPLTAATPNSPPALSYAEITNALSARNRELTEALQRETATSAILRAIAMSPTDPAPVFEAILDSALRLCQATIGALFRSDGQVVSLAAFSGKAALGPALRATYPRRIDAPGTAVRAIREGVTIHLADVQDDLSSLHSIDEAGEIRAQLSVPMIREGRCIGAIIVCRSETGLFPDLQVALVHTLADQAAIAIENVPLFTEPQEKNRALTEAHAQVTESLEQQTATAEILRVIASSPTELQPVLDSVAVSAAKLSNADDGSIFLAEGAVLRLVAHHVAHHHGSMRG